MADTHCLNSKWAHWPRLRPQSRHCSRPPCFRFRCQPQVLPLLRLLQLPLLQNLEPLQSPLSWNRTDVCPGQFRRPRMNKIDLNIEINLICAGEMFSGKIISKANLFKVALIVIFKNGKKMKFFKFNVYINN